MTYRGPARREMLLCGFSSRTSQHGKAWWELCDCGAVNIPADSLVPGKMKNSKRKWSTSNGHNNDRETSSALYIPDISTFPLAFHWHGGALRVQHGVVVLVFVTCWGALPLTQVLSSHVGRLMCIDRCCCDMTDWHCSTFNVEQKNLPCRYGTFPCPLKLDLVESSWDCLSWSGSD